MAVVLHVDCDVFRSLASGMGVYLYEILRRLDPSRVHVVCRGPQAPAWQETPGANLRRRLRKLPGAYWARQIKAGWPPVPRNAVFWAPNYFLPWPFTPALSVVTVQDLIFVRHPEWVDKARGTYFRRALARTLARATKVIVTTEHVASEVLELYAGLISREKIAVIPMGIRRLEEPKEAPESWWNAVVSYGNIEPRKDVLTLVRAHQKLSASLRRKHPLLVTGYPLDPSYSDQVELAVDPPLSQVLPRLNDSRLGGLVSRSALVVFPSLAEGFGLGPLEALSLGAPVLASDLRVTRELLGDKVKYFGPGNVSDLSARLEECLLCPERPSVADREALQEKFSWDRAARLHEALFMEAAGEAGQG